MNPMLHLDMQKATQLTREGRLAEATRLIQQILHGGASGVAGEAPTRPPLTIEGTSKRIEETEATGSGTACAKSPGSSHTIEQKASFARPALSEAPHLRMPLGRDGISARYRPTPASVIPSDAQFLTRSFTNAAGSRDYKLYIPSCQRGEGLPLVVMLHGCTQSADDFAIGTRMNEVAEENGFFVAYPMQTKSANAMGCWNWFKPGDQRRDAGEPSLIAGITSEVVRGYGVDPRRIYVAGLSAGGAAAAIMGAAYPDIYAAVGVHSGLPVEAASDLPSALAAMRQGSSSAATTGAARRSKGSQPIATIVFHGDRDTTVHPSNGADVIEQLCSAQSQKLRVVTNGGTTSAGRAYSRTSHLDGDRTVSEMWTLHGAGHAWSGGSSAGSYTDPHGPDASREMIRFFLQQSRQLPAS